MRGMCSPQRYIVMLGVFVITIFGLNAQAQSPQELFNEGNRLLAETRYSEALQYYRQIEEAGFESGPLYLNMGIAASFQDSLGLAKFYYLKAAGFPGVERAAREGLDFVEDVLGRRGARLPQLAWTRLSTQLFFHVNYSIWLLIGVVLVNIGAVILVLKWIKGLFVSRVGLLAPVSLSLGGLIIILAIALQMNATRFDLGVQVSREAQVRELPHSEAEIRQTGFEGFQYIVDIRKSATVEGWLNVRMSNGTRGWVEEELVKRFK